MSAISPVGSVPVSSGVQAAAIPQQLIQSAKALGIDTRQYSTAAQLRAAIQARQAPPSGH
jgi:hypothetical protein